MSQVTEEIKSKIGVIDLLSEYIQLKRAGASYKALCPFHHEKTPSFMVSPERQSWHCFGCNTGGDIFEFVMKMEGLEFPEALKLLADKAGVKLPVFSSEISASQRNRLLDILKLAAKFYHKVLLDLPQAQEARDYLSKRGVAKEMVEEFQLGFIPEAWDRLTVFLLKKGFGINDLIAAGVTIKKEGGGNYDRFRGRIMFPLADVHGHIVGFTGRLLEGNNVEAGGKYVNTPQTLVYDKGRLIYALDKAKFEARRQDRIIIVEGQMDVVACHQFGQANTVAASGTALTREQIKLLKRFSNNLFIAFDVDPAGQSATARGIEMTLNEGMKIKIIAIPKEAGKDPDECLKNNPEAWFKAVAEAQSIMEYFFATILAGKDLKKPEDRSLAAQNLLEKICQLPDPVEQDYWVKKLAGILDIRDEILYEKMATLKRKPSGAGAESGEKEKNIPVFKKTKEESASEKILALALHWPNLFPAIMERLNPQALTPLKNYDFYENFVHFYNTEKEFIQKGCEFISKFREKNNSRENCQTISLLELLYDKEFADLSQEEAWEEISTVISFLNLCYNNNIRQILEKQMREAEHSGDQLKVNELMKKFKDFL